jgi:hypothetical protein
LQKLFAVQSAVFRAYRMNFLKGTLTRFGF